AFRRALGWQRGWIAGRTGSPARQPRWVPRMQPEFHRGLLSVGRRRIPRCPGRGWRRDNLDNLDNLYNLYRVYRVYRVSGWYRKREMNRGSQSVLISPLCGPGIGTSTATVVGRVLAVPSPGLSLTHPDCK